MKLKMLFLFEVYTFILKQKPVTKHGQSRPNMD